MKTKWRRSNRPILKRTRLTTIRRNIHREYQQAIEDLRAMLKAQTALNERTYAELDAERRLTLRAHLRTWLKEGPWPRRWMAFISR